LLKHEFLKVKPDDKEIEVQSLHTLRTLDRDSKNQLENISLNVKLLTIPDGNIKNIQNQPFELNNRVFSQSYQ
jgi:hypothetical protein